MITDKLQWVFLKSAFEYSSFLANVMYQNTRLPKPVWCRLGVLSLKDLVSVLDSYVTAIHTEAVWQTASVKKMPVGYGCGQACEHFLTSDWQQRAQLPTVAAGPGVYKWASQGSHGRPGSKQHPSAYVGCCPSVPVPISSHDGQCCRSVGHISPSSPACIGRGVVIATATLRQRRKWLGLGWNKVRILTNK